MGNRETKCLDVNRFVELAGSFTSSRGAEASSSKHNTEKELAACLASLSDMANTGINTALPELQLPGGGRMTSTDLTPRTVRRVSLKVKQRIEAHMSHVNRTETCTQHQSEFMDMVQNLSLEDSEEGSEEWIHMRSWLVWSLHNNLDDDDDDEEDLPRLTRMRRRKFSRQMSSDHGNRLDHRRLSHQSAIVVQSDGIISAQSSLESNADS